MDQLSFISALEPKREEARPLTKLELLAAGLKRDRMGALDRLERLQSETHKLNERRGDAIERNA